MKKPFWRWAANSDGGERTLYIDGVIAEETWYGDEITPKAFKGELQSGSGNITVWINSPGGDVWAAAQIYNMLMEYKGDVTMKVDAYAASAATIIAMAGTRILMSPIAELVIHNPQTFAMGDEHSMMRAYNLLTEVKDSIILTYEIKTGLPANVLSEMMDAETTMSARKAVELGFADEIMYTNDRRPAQFITDFEMFSQKAVTNSLLKKLGFELPIREEAPPGKQPPQPKGTPVESLEKRLSLLSH